ncbi:Uncharacterised protein [Burkholderia pseudomallei]|nr:Uncharacterised protein [Burkholderia pseudomallei]VBH23008.1 Uncharacterised protein [Burkholderia pseudomallei]
MLFNFLSTWTVIKFITNLNTNQLPLCPRNRKIFSLRQGQYMRLQLFKIVLHTHPVSCPIFG